MNKREAAITGLEILQQAETIVAKFHEAALKQDGVPVRHINDLATCCRVLRGLINVGEGLKEKEKQ